MTLRRPAAHLTRAPGWRRSGDESCWESLISEDVLTPVARLPCAPRPQSAIEGRQLDNWLEHLHELQSNLLTATVHDQVPGFINNRTASVPAFNKEPTGNTWRQLGIPPFSRSSSSCGSSSLCESSLGSQESLQTGLFSPPETRGSWERAHIVQAPRKEQPQLSYLGQVKTGWLPIQRRVKKVSDACDQNQVLDHSAVQVKLKQPITPVFQKTQAVPKAQDGVVERCHSSHGFTGAKTWQPPDQDCPVVKQMPEKQRFPAREGDRPTSWQVLRRGWNTNRVSAFPGGTQSTELPTGMSSDPNRKPALMKTTGFEPLNHAPLHQTASAEPWRPHTPLQGANSTDTYESHSPFNRKSSVQPVRATAPLCRTNPSSQQSQVQTSSAVTTLVPQSKIGFSSITISSRKVSRSASLPGSSSQSSGSPSPPPAHHPSDPSTRRVTVQQKATVVKVKEQSVSTTTRGTTTASQGLDTVVHRRKATIIKVTEHRASYSSAKVEHGTRRPEYRHSYTEGVFKDNSTWSHSQHVAAPLYDHPEAAERPNPAVKASTSDSEKHGGALQRSTLSLILSSPPAKTAPGPSGDPPTAVGQRSDRPRRPQSWYGNAFGHSEPRDVPQGNARKFSFGLPQETSVNPVNSESNFISPGTPAKEAGQLVAENSECDGGNTKDPEWRASPCLTLIKAPDPRSHQTPEEVLALNAAAIIANIKLQRQRSMKKTQNGNSEEDASASPQRNAVTDGGGSTKSHPDQSPVRRHSLPTAAFISVSLGPERSPEAISLQEALQRSRPDFIVRSRGRVRELERRTRERRELASVREPQADAAVRQKRTCRSRSTSLKDNLFKPRDGAAAGREMQLGSKHPPIEVKRGRDEVQKRDACLSNRQKVVLFKKKLLDQILHRSSS